MADISPLDYRPPGRQPPSGGTARFFVGLVIGSAASLVYWPVVWHSGGSVVVPMLVLFVMIKFAVAAAFLSFPERREIGAGLLVSFLIGFMIFFGVCASNFKI